MAIINYTPNFLEDMVRVTDFLTEASSTEQALIAYDIIQHGIQTLVNHPEIGRISTRSDFRELVISYGNTGYIALYRYNQLTDIVTITAIRHQREVDYH